MNNKVIETYLEEFKKHHRYNPTILGKIKRIENYITNLQEENKEWSMIFDTFSKRPYAHKYLEEKKIPEKLGKIDDNDGYIDQNDVIKIGKKVDEIIDYLKSKGE